MSYIMPSRPRTTSPRYSQNESRYMRPERSSYICGTRAVLRTGNVVSDYISNAVDVTQLVSAHLIAIATYLVVSATLVQVCFGSAFTHAQISEGKIRFGCYFRHRSRRVLFNSCRPKFYRFTRCFFFRKNLHQCTSFDSQSPILTA